MRTVGVKPEVERVCIGLRVGGVLRPEADVVALAGAIADGLLEADVLSASK